VGYGIITPLAVAGLLISLKNWRNHLLIWLFGCTVLATLMSTIILGRYRLTLVPLFILYAAAAFVAFLTMVQRREIARAAAFLMLIVGVAATQNWLVPIPILREIPSFTVHGPLYTLSAYIYASEGKFERAFEELDRLKIRAKQFQAFQDDFRNISMYEGNYRVAWAMHLIEDGHVEAAREQLTLAQTSYTDHLHLSGPNYNLGMLHLKVSEPLTAKPLFDRFLAIEPEGPRADHVRHLLSEIKGIETSHR
jgi:hypothetical protein